MTEELQEQLLADCLENFSRRRAMGEKPRPEDYRERLGEDFDEFRGILAAESALSELIEQDSEGGLPRVYGDYTLLRVLGRGAMGVVYEAVHRPLGRKVAVKVLRTGFDTEPEALERFRREARACAQVKHDHIVDIYEAGSVEDRPFYAMELLEGQSLADLIRAGEAPDPKKLARGMAGVADALETLHRAGVIHRDVKPANILVQPDGRMILADFGLARSIASDGLTQTGQVLGTPLYMSPEQFLARRGEVDDRADVYGLGVTMYEALAGHPPFSAPDSLALMRMILNERPVSLSEAAPGVPLPLAFLVMKAMENRKEDRYQTAAAMRDDLLAFAEDRPVVGRPVSTLRHRVRRLRRWMPAAAAVILAAAVGLWFWSNRDGTLTVRSSPVASVSLDGRLLGDTEVMEQLAPGRYEVLVHRERFLPRRALLSLESGQDLVQEYFLVPRDRDDEVALTILGDSLGVDMAPLSGPVATRGAARGEVRVLLPGGRILREDLTKVRLGGDPFQVEDGDEIRLFRGEELLTTLPLTPERAAGPIPVPEGILDRLAPGDEVRLEYVPASGAGPRPQEATLVAGPAERLEEVGKRIAGQPAAVRRLILARLYLSEGLPAAAYRVASAVPESPRAVEIELAALEALGLRDTLLYADARIRHRRLSD